MQGILRKLDWRKEKLWYCDNFVYVNTFMNFICYGYVILLLFILFFFRIIIIIFFLELLLFHYVIQWRLQMTSFSFIAFLLLLDSLCTLYAWFCTPHLDPRNVKTNDMPWIFSSALFMKEALDCSLCHYNSHWCSSHLWIIC